MSSPGVNLRSVTLTAEISQQGAGEVALYLLYTKVWQLRTGRRSYIVALFVLQFIAVLLLTEEELLLKKPKISFIFAWKRLTPLQYKLWRVWASYVIGFAIMFFFYMIGVSHAYSWRTKVSLFFSSESLLETFPACGVLLIPMLLQVLLSALFDHATHSPISWQGQHQETGRTEHSKHLSYKKILTLEENGSHNLTIVITVT